MTDVLRQWIRNSGIRAVGTVGHAVNYLRDLSWLFERIVALCECLRLLRLCGKTM